MASTNVTPELSIFLYKAFNIWDDYLKNSLKPMIWGKTMSMVHVNTNQILAKYIYTLKIWLCNSFQCNLSRCYYLEINLIRFRRFCIVLPKTALLNNLNKSLPALSLAVASFRFSIFRSI